MELPALIAGDAGQRLELFAGAARTAMGDRDGAPDGDDEGEGAERAGVADLLDWAGRRGVPIVFAETLGYRGNNYTGHETVVRAVLDQYVAKDDGPAPQTRKGLVNVWAALPYQNPFWRGDLAEIRRILEGVGLEVNILFGPASQGLDEWRAIPSAQLNIVLSPWLGLSVARRLEEVYNQPVLHEPAIPIGARATSAFLRRAGEAVGVATTKVEAFIAREERDYYNYLRDFAHFYAGCTSQYRLPSRAVQFSIF